VVETVPSELEPQPAPLAARRKPGPKPAPPIRVEDLFGGRYVRSLQAHLARLRAAHAHPNRTLFFDDVAVAYLLAFFSPAIRSLRTLDDFSQTAPMRQQTSVDRIPRSTLSDANKVFDPALLGPIIEDLRARVPDLQRTDAKLGQLTQKVRAVDASLFTVAANVAWALKQRRPNGKGRATVRLNLQWAAAAGVPEGVSISGADASEAQALMAGLEPDLIYVMDRGYVNFELLDRILHACSDFVLRLKSNTNFTKLKDLPLSDEDRAAGVVSDRIGRLSGSADSPAPGAMVREVVILNPDQPDRPVRLLTSLLDVPAHVVGRLYRWRWKIELFFRWLKVHAHFEHLTSHSENGVAAGFYIAVIGVLLMYVHTQRPVSKYAYVLLGMVAAGQTTMGDILPILERRERECDLDRQRRARKRAEKTGK
jgi:Transposase DDE domain